MDPFYKQDIFFLVTTIAVAVATILLAIATIYIIKILRDVKYISKKAKAETDHLAEDIEELRTNVRQEGAKLKSFSKFVKNIYKRHKR